MDQVRLNQDGKLDINWLLYRNTENMSFQDLLLLEQQNPDLYAKNEFNINEYMEKNGLAEDYARAQGLASGDIASDGDLVALLEADNIDFNALAEAGFDDLKDIEHARPDLIVKLQAQLEEQGLYVTDPDHKYYRDGKIGTESSSVTWNGVKLAAERGYEHAQDNIAGALSSDVNSQNSKLHLEQSLNRVRTEEGREHIEVNGRAGEQVAHEIYQRFSEDPSHLDNAGRLSMRILDDNIETSTLNSLVAGNSNAEGVLDYVRTHEFHSGSFDYDAGTASAQTLLSFIGQYESRGRNVIYDGGDGTFVDLDNMTINQVLAYQDAHVAKGYASSAISPLQFIRDTLRATVASVPELTGNELMTPEVIERLGMELLDNRGLGKYLDGEISTDAFIYNLSQEWASLPKNSGGASYYAGDGLNEAHANYDELYSVLEDMKRNYHLELERSNAPELLLSENGNQSVLQTAWNNAGQEPEQPEIPGVAPSLQGQFAAARDDTITTEDPKADEPKREDVDVALAGETTKPFIPV